MIKASVGLTLFGLVTQGSYEALAEHSTTGVSVAGGDTGAASAAGWDTGSHIFDCMRDAVYAYSHLNTYTHAYA